MFSETHRSFRSRILFFYIVVMMVFGVLFFRYWYLQVVQGSGFYTAATENTLREVVVPSRRGRILASGGEVLADYEIAYNIMLDRNRLQPRRIPELARFLDLEVDEFQRRLHNYRRLPLYKAVPIMENLTFESVAKFEARRKDYPELFVEVEPQRSYPYRDLFAHAVGYIGEPTVKEAQKLTTLQKVGKSGIERSYDNRLRGRDGIRRIVVDSKNHFVRTQQVREPVHGRDLVLSLVVPLQEHLRAAMGKYQGAAVVMNPHTGQIYAMVSNPSFDPNVLTFRFAREGWHEIRAMKGNPMMNRATQGRYPPGSTFKPVMALAALSHGHHPGTRYTCVGGLEVTDRTFMCWNKTGHGELALSDAIAHSCNVYFYQLGLKLGIERIGETAALFHMGERTGIDIPGENPGFFPDAAWKKMKTGNIWFPGDTVNLSIGQGYLLCTPLEIAAVTSAIAADGKLVVPHLLQDDGDRWVRGTADIEARHFKTVRRGMRRMVTIGTGVYLNELGMSIAGKTGTAQTMSGDADSGRELSWFTGFTPVENAELTVVVIAEKGGHGSDTAVPIAAETFRFFRDNRELFQ